MTRHASIPPEAFEEILAWLHPERETAAVMYLQLRHDLARLFAWRACSDPEGLADEVFDRVARKVSELRQTYEGDPRYYFRAVAKNLAREEVKRIRNYVALDDVDLSRRKVVEYDESQDDMDDCLGSCLKSLKTERRELVLAYYAKEKQAKIDHRSELAARLGITVEALRVKVHRIRATLDTCIKNCLDAKVQ